MSESNLNPSSVIDKDNIVGGLGATRAYLLSKINGIKQDRFEIGIGDLWEEKAVLETFTREFEPDSPFGRYSLGLEDARADQQCWAKYSALMPRNVSGRSFVATVWVKHVSGEGGDPTLDIDGFQLQMVSVYDDGGPTEDKHVTGSLEIAAGTWNFVVLLCTMADVPEDQNIRTIQTRTYPQGGTGGSPEVSTGKVNIVAPRIYEIFEELTDFPLHPLKKHVFRGRIPVIRNNNPFLELAEAQAISGMFNHDGPILYRPAVDVFESYYMKVDESAWDFKYAGGKYIGYTGRHTLEGTEPILGAADFLATSDRELASDQYTTVYHFIDQRP